MAQTILDRNHYPEQPVSPLQTDFSSFPSPRQSRNDGEFVSMSPVSPILSRRTSHDSDRYSTTSGLTSHFPNNPTNVNPPPAYVAPLGASQVVSEHQASRNPPSSDSEDDARKKNKDDVQFSKGALALVNSFLDQLLYSFLSASRSTSLLALRPAVTEVLKHRLAQEAISSADMELVELLAGGDEEEDIDTKHRSQEQKRQWDLELVWKRTRLRVMVYMRLGEMEDDDEQRYVQEEELFYASERRFTSSTGLVSWSAAIFLTSVLEYVAEQTLQVAGQAAFTRARRQDRSHRRSMSSDVMNGGDLVVEEYDVEKVALNSMMGRLWRTWRKSLRNSAGSSTPGQRASPVASRSSRDNTASAMANRGSFSTLRDGSATNDSRPISRDQQDDIPEMQYPEHILAANIPLPLAGHARDIDEIIVPGLARDPDDESYQEESPDGPYSEHVLAVLVALPLVDERKDVDEIEVPGLAKDPDSVDDVEVWTMVSKEELRRKSFTDYSSSRPVGGLHMLDSSGPSSPSPIDKPLVVRARSSSLPVPSRMLLSDEEPSEGAALGETEVVERESKPQPVSHDVPEDVQAESIDDTVGNVEREATEQTSKTEFPWMGVAAATGASAVAAAAVASGSDESGLQPAGQPSRPETTAEEDNEEITKEIPGSWVEVEDDEARQVLPEKDVVELDKRKSLLDMKHLMFINSEETSGRQSPHAPDSPASSTARSASNDLSGLDSKKQVETSGVGNVENSVAVTRSVEDSPSGEAEAREENKRPSNLVIHDSATSPQESPTTTTSTPRTPRQFLDLTSEAESSTEQPPIPATQTSQNNDLINGVVQPSAAIKSSTVDTSPSRSLATSIHKKQNSDSTAVQEHPWVQRMAGLKGTDPIPSSESEKATPITSASIRGPEDFDLFVQGGETLKYTLTPEHVRDEPVSISRYLANMKTNAGQLDNQTRYASSSPVEMDATPSTNEDPPDSESRIGRSLVATGQTSTADKRRSVSRPSPTNTSSHRKSGLHAREPRVLTESTRDFADFIRSTGPNKEADVYPLVPNASSTSLHSLPSAHIYGASASRSSSPGASRGKTLGDEDDVPPVPPIPRHSKAGLEARGAKTVDNGSSELIDFIRLGPRTNGEHRISRTVAPFRTTMDSDQFDSLDTRQSVDRQGDSSLQTTPSVKSSSHRTSANSRSALLNESTGVSQTLQPAANGRGLSDGVNGASNNQSTLDNASTKKRYRNKDPYAIDFDDEDDDLIIATPKSSRKDEGLLEFLKNNEPLSNEPPRPLIDPNSAQARRIIANARAGNQAMGARPRTIQNGLGPANGFQPSSGHAQISSKVTTSKPKLEARSPGSKSRQNTSMLNTNDLADFIRNSGPPDDPNTAPAPSIERGSKLTLKEEDKARRKAEKKKSGGFFGRSRNQRYLDMP